MIENYAMMAAASRAAAAGQVLDNVRQKHLFAAASWDRLALGVQKMDALRIRRASERAAATAPQVQSDVE